MPLRRYRCRAGHEFELVESMGGPRMSVCPEPAHTGICGAQVEPLIQRTQRPIIKSGTPIHHKRTKVT